MTTITATQPTNSAQSAVVSTRLLPEEMVLLDALAEHWGTDRSGALRKFLRTSGSEKVRRAIEDADYVWQRVLPHATKYKLRSDWRGLIGIVEHSFKKGDVLSRDLHPPELIAALHERGAILQALPE
jgi:hypothetical protein